jgi:DNA helicase-2/ATP-dependent DNA helicase PcrA
MKNKLLVEVNEKQRSAITHPDTPLLIIAGAGSGKTKTLTHRIAWAIAEKGKDPSSIVALTFTNKAAGEMTGRLMELLQGQSGQETFGSFAPHMPFVGTFHKFCLRLISMHPEKVGLSPRFSIFDEDDSKSALKKVIRALSLDDKQFSPAWAKEVISSAKNETISPESLRKRASSQREETAAEIYDRYQKFLAENNAVDFDDILLLPLRLFSQHPKVLENYQQQYTSLFVDEYQDTNLPQYRLLQLLAGKHRNISVVGDVDQAIYGWRGADYKNILRFETDWPDASVVILDENYRSTKTVLDAANKVIEKNLERKEKNLWTRNAQGDPITTVIAGDAYDEARWAANEIKKLVTAKKFRYQDIAVLYRTNGQSRVIEELCLTEHIPYRIIGGTQFYERKEVKDVLAYLRILSNPRDLLSLHRIVNVPPRGFGDIKDADIAAISKRDISHMTDRRKKAATAFFLLNDALLQDLEKNTPAKLIQKILKTSGYETYLRDGTEEGEQRYENVQELITVASEYTACGAEGLSAFLERVSLVQDADALETSNNVIHLMTLHTAKGLEYPVIFMFGMEEGIFPHARSFLSPVAMEEERRLCYVGMTRAKKKLYLLAAQQRKQFGQSSANPPSRYLFDIPPHLTEMIAPRAISREDREEGIIGFGTGDEDDVIFF